MKKPPGLNLIVSLLIVAITASLILVLVIGLRSSETAEAKEVKGSPLSPDNVDSMPAKDSALPQTPEEIAIETAIAGLASPRFVDKATSISVSLLTRGNMHPLLGDNLPGQGEKPYFIVTLHFPGGFLPGPDPHMMNPNWSYPPKTEFHIVVDAETFEPIEAYDGPLKK